MLAENTTKAKLKAGERVVGCSTMFVQPAVVEYIGRAGFDWILFDGEHGPVSPESIEIGVLAAENIGLTPLARVPVNRPEVILRFMDTGLAGVEGIDVLNVGTSDLSQSMGKPGQKDDPELIQMVERVIQVGKATGKAV